MKKVVGIVTFLFCVGCEAPVRQNLQVQEQPNEEMTPKGELCDKLANAQVSEKFIESLIKLLCSENRLENLRKIKFSGSGNAEVILEDKSRSDLGDKSQIDFYSALAVATTANSYYKMMRLQVSKPDDFSKAGFKSKEEVEYKVLKGAMSESVEYEYYDNSEKPEVEIGYAAKAIFITILDSELYIVGTTKMETFETVQELQAFTVVHKTNLAGSEGVEVFSISRQILDNNGDHDTVVSKTRNSLRKEVEMSYENGLNAAKADDYFVSQKN
jgi:hypothetical protein